jgi:hypothetical protein
MAKWRKTHYQVVESDDFNAMPDDFTRMLWLLLPLALDREGRAADKPALIKSKLLPEREDVTTVEVRVALDWYAARRMIERYEVDGKAYFWAPSFHKFQGDTSKESPSIYPAPPNLVADAYADEWKALQEEKAQSSRASREQGESLSGPTPELVQSKASTDSHADSDSHADADADADTHTDARGAGALAAAAGVVDLGGDDADDGLDGHEPAEICEELQAAFCEIMGIDAPALAKTQRQRDALQEKWVEPLARIAKMAGWDADVGRRLIRQAVDQLQGRGRLITCPRSIADTAGTLAGKARALRGGVARRDQEVIQRYQVRLPERQGVGA